MEKIERQYYETKIKELTDLIGDMTHEIEVLKIKKEMYKKAFDKQVEFTSMYKQKANLLEKKYNPVKDTKESHPEQLVLLP
jgi:hypothetical protein